MKRSFSAILILFLTVSLAFGTVTTSTSRINYNCGGSVVDFTFGFGVGATDEIQVILTNSSGTETVLTETTHYTVSCTNSDCEAGGKVVTVATYASGNTITILRSVPVTQESDFTENQPTLYETFEDGLDKNIRIAQQQQEEIQRSIKLKKSYNPALYNIELTPVASRAIGFDAAGTALTTYPTTAVLNANFDSIQNYANNLSTAVLAIGAAQKTLIIDAATSLSGDTTVPTTLNLMILKSGLITIGSGVTLTIYSPANIQASSNQQIFTGSGTATFTNGGTVYPGWWGAVGDGATDDLAAIQLALDTLSRVQLLGKTYFISAEVTLKKGTILQGVGMDRTFIKGTHAGNLIKYVLSTGDAEVSGTWVKDLTLDGVSTANNGIGIYAAYFDLGVAGAETTRQSGIENCKFTNLLNGLQFGYSQGFSIKDSKFYGNVNGVYHSTNEAVTGTAQIISFYDCDFRGNTTGVHTEYVAGSKAYDWVFVSCHFESNVIGLDLVGNLGWQFINCKWEQNDSEAIRADNCDVHLHLGSYFNSNSDVDGDEQVFYGRLTPLGSFGIGDNVFISCRWAVAGIATIDLKLIETSGTKLINCQIEGTKISTDKYSAVNLDGLVGVGEFPDPMLSNQRVLMGWITHTDLAAGVILGSFTHNKTTLYSSVYLEQIKIHLTESFSQGGGTFVRMSVGQTTSAQSYSASTDVTVAPTVITPVMNKLGYTVVSPPDIKITLTTDGALDANGKALVVVPYYDAPKSP